MIDKRIGKRLKQQREAIGLTQEELASKLGLTTNYISTVERGASFPRCDKLISLLNGLNSSADAIFCDVVNNSHLYYSNRILSQMKDLSPESQKRILQIMEALIEQEKSNNS